MSPIRPFKSITWSTEERGVYRYGMTPPAVGDVIERDGEQVEVLRVRVSEPTDADRKSWDIWPGDFIVSLEYRPVSTHSRDRTHARRDRAVRPGDRARRVAGALVP